MMRRTALAAALAAMLGLTAGLPAWAQDADTAETADIEAVSEAGPEAVEEATDHGSDGHGAGDRAGGAGMPQLDASTYASQILWLIITFSVLFYLLRTKALPRVADILEARQERIANDLDKAAALRAEAAAAAEEYAKVVAEAQAKAGEAVKQTRDAVSADITRRTAALDEELAARIAAAEATVGQAREQALAELETVAVEAAQAATERLVGVAVSPEEARAALAQVRKEVA